MKSLFLASLFLMPIAFADDGKLSCSANGTIVYHVPGAFTSKKTQDDAATILNNVILKENPAFFDEKVQSAELISIPSQGIVQDKLNYIMNSYDSQTAQFAYISIGVLETGHNIAGVLEKTPGS